MNASIWPPVQVIDTSAVDGIVFCREEETFPDLLRRYPDCLVSAMCEEYVRVYDAHGEEKAVALLHEISNQLTSKTLSVGASDEEIIYFTRRLARSVPSGCNVGLMIPLSQPQLSAVSLTKNLASLRQG